MRFLAERGRGFVSAAGGVPIVPTAAIFDLIESSGAIPRADDGYAAAVAALAGGPLARGRVGAGRGATIGKWRGREYAVAGGFGVATADAAGAAVLAVAVGDAGGDVVAADGRVVAGSAAPAGGEAFASALFGEERGDPTLGGVAAVAGSCVRCPLAETRTQVVFGVGSDHAQLMFVGEGPGQQEDIQGEPFVGRAGKLLTQLIEGIGLTRAEVYIANVVKCRPPGNRDPLPTEIEACSPWLARQPGPIPPTAMGTHGTFATQLPP